MRELNQTPDCIALTGIDPFRLSEVGSGSSSFFSSFCGILLCVFSLHWFVSSCGFYPSKKCNALWTSVLNATNPIASELRRILLERPPVSQLNSNGSIFCHDLLEIQSIYSGLGTPSVHSDFSNGLTCGIGSVKVHQYNHRFQPTRPQRVCTWQAHYALKSTLLTDRFQSPVNSLVTGRVEGTKKRAPFIGVTSAVKNRPPIKTTLSILCGLCSLELGTR